MRLSILATSLFLTLAAPLAAEPAELLFASGFEGSVVLQPYFDGYQEITGRDSETGFSWPITILGATESALHPIDHDRFQALNSEITTIRGPHNRPTRTLYSEESYAMEGPDDATQSPYEILNIRDGREDLYVRYWIKINHTPRDQIYTWRTFFEWKSVDYAEGSGFRLISFIYTDDEGNPFWVWQGDASPERPMWEIENHLVPVPEEEWFLTEFYWHWSTGQDGRAVWRINGQIVGDQMAPTTRNNKPIDFIMLTQIYGNSNPKFQWIDDIEIWSDWPEKYNPP